MDIFVGGIPFKLKEKELREVFEKFGEVASATIIANKATRQNIGYGFVEMPDFKQAINAIESLNGSEMMGRKIIVNRAEENKDTPKKRVASDKRRSVKSKPEEKSNNEKRTKLEEKSYAILRSRRFPKKKTINVIKYGDNDKDPKKKRGGTKLAKNFKVGKRRKG